MRYRILILVGLIVSGCGFSWLDILNEKEKKVVYKQCLIKYNYSELEKRYSEATSKPSKQRIQYRAIQIKSKCKKRAMEHFSI